MFPEPLQRRLRRPHAATRPEGAGRNAAPPPTRAPLALPRPRHSGSAATDPPSQPTAWPPWRLRHPGAGRSVQTFGGDAGQARLALRRPPTSAQRPCHSPGRVPAAPKETSTTPDTRNSSNHGTLTEPRRTRSRRPRWSHDGSRGRGPPRPRALPVYLRAPHLPPTLIQFPSEAEPRGAGASTTVPLNDRTTKSLTVGAPRRLNTPGP